MDMRASPVEVAERNTDQLERLVAIYDRHARWALEDRYRSRAPSYFGLLLRKPRHIEVDDLRDIDAAVGAAGLTEPEVGSLYELTALVRGSARNVPGEPVAVLAVEVSLTIDEGTIARAVAARDVLRRAGYRADAVVGGEGLAVGLGVPGDVLVCQGPTGEA